MMQHNGRRLLLGVMVYAFFTMETILSAQFSFINQTNLLLSKNQTRSAIPGGAIDLDGDLIDDYAILDGGKVLKAYISYGNESKLSLIDSIKLSNNALWSMAIGDTDNNGYPNIFSSGASAGIHNSEFGFNTRKNKTTIANFFAQGSNTIDINNDGYLDLFVCNDDGYSFIYLNNKSDGLVLGNVINFALNDPTDGSGNYGSEWADVNGDFVPDLYIAKCRAGVNSAEDPRRINRLYINNNDGSFTERGAEFNCNIGDQSWVGTIGDLDNDGDNDIFIINHYAPHIILENIQNQGFEIVSIPNLPQSFGFQAVMRDLNNDGWLDIVIAGAEGVTLLENKQNLSFTIHKNLLGSIAATSILLSDCNDDGKIDIRTHYPKPINGTPIASDQIWVNNSPSGKFVKFYLEGSLSNRSGVGSTIRIYGDWGVQMRTIKGGESYGIVNSLGAHFGLGEHSLIDSLIINWPSGAIDKFYNLEPNKTYLVQESKCITTPISWADPIVFIQNDALEINAPSNFMAYLWNEGSTNQSITINRPGKYHVAMIDSMGCKYVSAPLFIKNSCFTNSDEAIFTDKSLVLCATDINILNAPDAQSYLWNIGATSKSIELQTSGIYQVTISDDCGNSKSDTIDITIINPQPTIEDVFVDKNEDVEVYADISTIDWYADNELTHKIGEGNPLIILNIQDDMEVYGVGYQIQSGDSYSLGIQEFPGNNPYSSNTINGKLEFAVYANVYLKSIKVSTDTPGERAIWIKTMGRNDTIFYKNYFIKEGVNTLELDINIPIGSYEITTDERVNFSSFNHKGPRLVRTFNQTNYPYAIEEYISINNAFLGPTYYYYFYDWEVIVNRQNCYSQPVKVHIYVDTLSSTNESGLEDDIHFYPNPSTNYIQLTGITHPILLSILTMDGKVIRSVLVEKEGYLNISNISAGIYILHWGRNRYKKLVIY